MSIVIFKKMEKVIPVLYREKEECCGCAACASVCPQRAIEMLPDEEGFLYPVIHTDKCIGCGVCLRVCIYKE